MSAASDNYRLCVVRRTPLATPDDLTATLEWIVRALAQVDPLLFTLSGRSPANHLTPVMDGDETRVAAFLSTSAIEWNFGREPEDPTHEIVFFNPEEGPRVAVLRLSFVAGGEASTGPGLVVELVLGRDAAGPADEGRGAHLDLLFSMLLAALLPDHGHVELPGYPDGAERPAVYDVGWITYFSRAERPLPPALDPPAVMVPTDAGTKIFATPALALERHVDLADVIGRVREQLAPHLDEQPPAPEQPAGLPGHVQRPSFLAEPGARPPMAGPTFLVEPGAQPPQPPAHVIDDEATAVGIPLRPPPAFTLPFPTTATPPTLVPATPFTSTPSTPRVDATPFRPKPGGGGVSQPPPPEDDPDPNRRKPR
jgi:hypothetical protein